MAPQKKLGNWIFKSNGSDVYHEGHMFPLCVEEQLDSWPEKDIRSREWVSLNTLCCDLLLLEFVFSNNIFNRKCNVYPYR